jgi:hypothetical protein
MGIALIAIGCGVQTAADNGSSSPLPIRFTEVARELGIDFISLHRDDVVDHICESMGSGAAWLDYDSDGDWDAYVVTGKDRPNALYRNDGERFTNVAGIAQVGHLGWGMGVAAADYDGDGWTDLFVTNYAEKDVLYRNLGNGSFEDVTEAAGVGGAPSDWSSSAAWGDIDGDGDLDLYVARYIDFSEPDAPTGLYPSHRDELMTLMPELYPSQANALFRNAGDGTFDDVTDAAGVADAGGKGLGVLFGDYDNDGDLDLHVANDQTPNVLFKNDGTGVFSNVSFMVGLDDTRGGMGTDFGDYDGDGDLDMVLTNWQKESNALYRNNTVPTADGRASDSFDDYASEAGLAHTSLGLTGWGAVLKDFDLDGDLDLFVTNGYTSPAEGFPERCIGQRDQCYRNDDNRFVEVRGALEDREWGSGRGLASADYDGDGDIDLLVVQNNDRVLLMRNDTPRRGGWVRVHAPVGARLRIESGGKTYIREIRAGASYLSTCAPEIIVPAPLLTGADRVTMITPTRVEATDVPAGSTVVFTARGDATITPPGS